MYSANCRFLSIICAFLLALAMPTYSVYAATLLDESTTNASESATTEAEQIVLQQFRSIDRLDTGVHHQLSLLTPEDLAVLAAHPDMIQVGGDSEFGEFVLWYLVLVAGIFAIIVLVALAV